MLVSNTSTLVLLAKIRCLETFIELSPTIQIPCQVKQESLFVKDSYDARLIQKMIQEKRIVTVSVADKSVRGIMSQFNLHEGEAAAFAMFDHKKHKAILTDDGELIKLCKLEKVPFICAMAVVIRLYEKKQVAKEEALAMLGDLYGIGRYSELIYNHFKSEVV